MEQTKTICDFCDERKPDGSIPACGRPAVTEIRRVDRVGLPETAKVCEIHAEKIDEEKMPKIPPPLPQNPEEAVEFFEQKPAVHFHCKGCGKRILDLFEDAMLGSAKIIPASSLGKKIEKLGGLDMFVLHQHLESCGWRRKNLR